MMNNLQSSAFVAKTTQLLSSVARLRLLLVMLLTLTVCANAWADYTITFKTSGSNTDGSNAQTTIANLISSGGGYVSSISASKAYNGKNGFGVKLGSSSSVGNVAMTLTNSGNNIGQIKASKLIVNAAYFKSGPTLKVTATYTDNTTSVQSLSLTANIAAYDVALTSTKTLKSIKIESVKGSSECRAYCHSIKVVAASAAVTTYTVTYDLNGGTGTIPTQAKVAAGGKFTLAASSGFSNAGYSFAGWNDGTTTYNAGATYTMPAKAVTLKAQWTALPKYTVTLNAGSGTCAESVTEPNAGDGVTLPTPTLNGCDEWTFAGWATFAVATETSSKPTTLLTGTYKPTANTTLYAVYQRTEDGGGSSEYSKLNWGSNIKAGKYLISTGTYTVTGKNGNKTSELAVVDYTPSTEQETNYEFTISEPDNDGYFTIKLPDNSCWVGWSTSTSTALSETEPSDDQYLWKYSSNGIQNKKATTRYLQVNGACTAAKVYTTDNPGTNWKHTYLYSFSSGSTIYYHSTPDCTKETVPSLSASVSSLAVSSLSFGNVTVYQNSPKTFILNGSNLTADAILALSGTNAGMFSVSPTPVTPSNGSITNQTITVTYTPTAKASHSAKLTISSTGAESIEIQLSGTGVAQTANYTVNHYQQNITDDNYTLKETENLSGEVGTKVTPAFKSYEGFTAPTEEKSVEITADGKAIVEYQYARNSYTLTWNLDGGTITTAGTPEGEVKYGASLTAPVVKKDGFNFKGWDSEVPNTMPAANATYTAQWKKKHTIKWIVNGDTDNPYETTYVVDGDALALPSNPNVPSTCEEKVFIGWTESANVNTDGSDIEYVDENTLPNTDKTYYAVFASQDGNGNGDYVRVTSELSNWSGEYLIVYETSETTGVAFDGSGNTDDQIDKTNNNVAVTIDNNTIQATDNLNNRTFIIEDMSPDDCSEFDYYDYYSIRTKGGAYIGRESDSSNGIDIFNTPYPHQIYWIEVDNLTNGQEEAIIYSVINCDPSKALLLFNSRDAEKRFRYFNTYQEPIALYRKSSYTDYTTVCVETYNVIYDANGATSGNVPVDENNYILDAIVTVLGNTGNLQKTHYSFVGWNTQADGNGTSYQAGGTFTITEDVTLYAIWEEVPQYSVTWYVNGKQLTNIELSGASTSVYEGERITKTPPAPNPEDFCGQVFVGWTDAEMDVNDTNKPTIYNLVDEFPIASGDQTFYAVFADYVTE